jgi:hypothetical protein
MASTVAVPVQSAWASKINWTQLVGVATSAATLASGVLPPQYAALGAIAIQAIQGVATWYLRTFQTTTVTPSSIEALVGGRR